jgi:hypothetical protein
VPIPDFGQLQVAQVVESLGAQIGPLLSGALGLGVVVVGALVAWRLMLRLSGLDRLV